LGAELNEVAVPGLPEELSADKSVQHAEHAAKDLVLEGRHAVAAVLRKARLTRGLLDRQAAAWEKTVGKATEKYREWLGQVGGDKPKLMAQRKRLTQEEARIRRDVKRLEASAGTATTLRARRDSLLDQMDALAGEIFDARLETYAAISTQSGDRVRLDLTRGGNRRLLREGLLELKRGSYVRETEIAEIAQSVTPRVLVDCVIDRDKDRLSQAAGVDPSTASRLIEILTTCEDFAQVLGLQHLAFPEDLPRLQFRKDDGAYYDLKNLSVGQKCSVLLVIALAEGVMPVVVDQPEDALDIPSVYQDITLQVRAGKERRQFILTTHNATVAVSGDSDKFIILKGSATSGAVDLAGGIERESVRGQVIQHLEGGLESLNLKRKKYHVDPS